MDFQSVNPDLFVLIGELLGNVMANQMPLNVQNAVGNWLELVGQVILTYNAQQQYYQQGPGRYFTPDSFNVDNSSCQSNSDSSSNNNQTSSENTITPEQLMQVQQSMEQLLKRIQVLEQEIQLLKDNNQK